MADGSLDAAETHERLCDELAGQNCPVEPDCDGTLREGTYKGNRALVCEACGTPATRVWD